MPEATHKYNVSLNSGKLQFKQSSVNFYDHTLTEKGIHIVAGNLNEICNLKTQSNVKEPRAISGMVTYLTLCSVKLAEMTSPINELTKKNTHLRWESYHQAALDKIMMELCLLKIIPYSDPNLTTPTILWCDANQTGLKA